VLVGHAVDDIVSDNYQRGNLGTPVCLWVYLERTSPECVTSANKTKLWSPGFIIIKSVI
jgi:hypothetical protein